MYIKQFTNGAELIMMAFGTTGLIFLGLSAIAMSPARNFNRVGSFCAAGAIVCNSCNAYQRILLTHTSTRYGYIFGISHSSQVVLSYGRLMPS